MSKRGVGERSKAVIREKARPQSVPRGPLPDNRRAEAKKRDTDAPPTVSGRWLLTAIALSLAGAAFCCWGALCLLFWQGSWQLLYHPAAPVSRTPASVGLAFDPVQFALSDAGLPQLKGWWIPAPPVVPMSRFTVLYLHGETGNISGSVDALARLHAVGVNVLAFDYRGYGQSQFVRPSEAHWREDADRALSYLTGTRHINPAAIVLDGDSLGANLALEAAAEHPELAGVVLNSPLEEPMSAIFNDARAHMVPAHLLVRDRYDLNAAARDVRIPVLWFALESQPEQSGAAKEPKAYREISARKMLVWINTASDVGKKETDSLDRWLDEIDRH